MLSLLLLYLTRVFLDLITFLPLDLTTLPLDLTILSLDFNPLALDLSLLPHDPVSSLKIESCLVSILSRGFGFHETVCTVAYPVKLLTEANAQL